MKTMIAGGYGNVGSVIAETLAKAFPDTVVIAGRRAEKAEDLIRRKSLQAQAFELDIAAPLSGRPWPQETGTVICCVEVPGSALLEACVRLKINYIEIGTSYERYERFFRYRQEILEAGITVIPAVGLIPGLFNVFAYHAFRHGGKLEEVRTYVMLGLGDSHGLDAIRWMLSYANRSFILQNQEDRTVRRSLSEPRRTRFLHEKRKRTFYLFDLADHHTIPLTTGAKSAETRLAFDSRFITWLIGLFSRIGLFRRAEKWNAKRVKRLLDKLRFGRDGYAVQVHARTGAQDTGPDELIYLVRGREEARATGLVAAFAAIRTGTGRLPSGLVPIEQALPFRELIAYLEERGMHFESNKTELFQKQKA